MDKRSSVASDAAKKEEAVRLGQMMANKRNSQAPTPTPTPQSRLSGVAPSGGNKSPRSSKRDSAFEGVTGQGEGAEKISVAESALSRNFRLLADLFDDDKKGATVAARRDALAKYRDLIDVQEANLKSVKEAKAAQLVAEHRQVLADFEATLDQTA